MLRKRCGFNMRLIIRIPARLVTNQQDVLSEEAESLPRVHVLRVGGCIDLTTPMNDDGVILEGPPSASFAKEAVATR